MNGLEWQVQPPPDPRVTDPDGTPRTRHDEQAIRGECHASGRSPEALPRGRGIVPGPGLADANVDEVARVGARNAIPITGKHDMTNSALRVKDRGVAPRPG